MSILCGRSPRGRGAFTLIELLVVVAIIALLISILLPTLRSARRQARVTVDLSNLRGLGQAHWIYMGENDGRLLDIGLAHGSATGLDARVSWVNVLERAYGQPLMRRSPLDKSRHLAKSLGGQGLATDGATIELDQESDPKSKIRRTSYGVNNLLTASGASGVFDPRTNRPVDWFRLERIRRPTAVVYFLHMAREGSFASADHPHVEEWDLRGITQLTPRLANDQVQIDVVNGPPQTFEAQANYGFLDGHADKRVFGKVWRKLDDNNFWPDVAW